MKKMNLICLLATFLSLPAFAGETFMDRLVDKQVVLDYAADLEVYSPEFKSNTKQISLKYVKDFAGKPTFFITRTTSNGYAGMGESSLSLIANKQHYLLSNNLDFNWDTSWHAHPEKHNELSSQDAYGLNEQELGVLESYLKKLDGKNLIIIKDAEGKITLFDNSTKKLYLGDDFESAVRQLLFPGITAAKRIKHAERPMYEAIQQAAELVGHSFVLDMVLANKAFNCDMRESFKYVAGEVSKYCKFITNGDKNTKSPFGDYNCDPDFKKRGITSSSAQ